jgi:hypothetical protein
MPQYTVFLTKGTYLVDEADAERIRTAVASRNPFVEVGVDLRCDGVVAHRAEIATSHVVTLVRVPDARAAEEPALGEHAADGGNRKVRSLFSAF